MGDFLSFRRMVSPTIIQVLFWIGVVATILAGLSMIANRQPAGWLVLVMGPLFVRIVSEMLILFFRINETLTDIRNDGRKSRPPEPPPTSSETRPLPTV